MSKQQKILHYLENCAVNKSLAHAYVLVGPAAAGGRETLVSFLKSFLDAKNLEHPDIRLVAPLPEKDSISIEQIRELRGWLALSPLSAKNKVAVVDPAAAMPIEAQNAFLKVLEEPVANTYLFLLVGHRRLLLPTIFSRVVPIYFNRESVSARVTDNLLEPFLTATDPSARLRLWMQSGPDKEQVRGWLIKIIPELRQLFLRAPSVKLARITRALLLSLSGPTGQNWSLIAENLIISI